MATLRINGWMWRVTPQGVTRRVSTAGRWEPVTRAQLLALAVDSDEWAWLREQGVKRSTATSSQPETERAARQVLLRLLPVHSRQLDILAKRWGCSRSEVVSTLIVNEIGSDKS